MDGAWTCVSWLLPQIGVVALVGPRLATIGRVAQPHQVAPSGTILHRIPLVLDL